MNPLKRLAAVQQRGIFDPYGISYRFNYKPQTLDLPKGTRLAEALSSLLAADFRTEKGAKALKLTLEIWQTSGPAAITPRLYGHLLRNICSELKKTRVSDLKKEHANRLQVLEHLMYAMEGLEAQHYTLLITMAHLVRRPKMVQDVWETAMLSGCDKTPDLYNAYLKAVTQGSPRLRRDPDLPEMAGGKFWATNQSVDSARATSIDPLVFMNEMREAGVEPSRITYMLALLHYGHTNNLPMAISICENLWGVGFNSGKLDGVKVPHTSQMHPTVFSLGSVIDAFGACDRLVEGQAYCETIAEIYGICLYSPQGRSYWTMLMRSALYTAVPYGQSSQTMCSTVWSTIVDFDFAPSPPQYSLRIRDLLTRDRLEELQTLMHFALSNDKNGELAKIVCTYLGPLCRKYTAVGNFPKAIEVVKTFQEFPSMQDEVATRVNLLEVQYARTGAVVFDTAEVGEVNEALVEELKYIPEDEEDEENFLQL